MRFHDYLATLPHVDQVRLLIAAAAGLREARLASEVVTGNGGVDDMRRHLQAAILQLGDALALLGPVDGNDSVA